MDSLPNWIQAIAAVGALILAIVVMIQNNRIRTLTDVVASLNEQNQIMQNLLTFEIKARLNQAQPNFVTHQISESNGVYFLSLTNKGLRARSVKPVEGNNVRNLKISSSGNIAVNHNDTRTFNYEIADQAKPFSFKLTFEDDHDNMYEQTVYTRPGSNTRIKITISKPVENP